MHENAKCRGAPLSLPVQGVPVDFLSNAIKFARVSINYPRGA